MSYKPAGSGYGYLLASYTAKPVLLTLACWAKQIDNPPNGAGAFFDSAAGTYGWHFGTVSGTTTTNAPLRGQIEWSTSPMYELQSPGEVALAGWVPLVMTIDSSAPDAAHVAKLYAGSSTPLVTSSGAFAAGTLDQTAAPWYLMNRLDTARQFNGKMAHGVIAGRIWSATEIGHFCAGRNPMDLTYFTGGAPDFYNAMKDGVTGVNNQFVGTLAPDVTNPPSLDSADNPTVDAPPAPSLTKKWQIPAVVTDGTARRLYVLPDTAGGMPILSASVIAAGGFFKANDATLTVGQKRPVALLGFGPDETFEARGGAAWATGIEE